MRIIDGIPESDLIELFLGDQTPLFKKTEMTTWSPSFESHQDIVVYFRYNNEHGVGVYYSNTVKSIVVSLKVKLKKWTKEKQEGWFTIEHQDFLVMDPESPQKVQECIQNYLNSANQGPSAQKNA